MKINTVHIHSNPLFISDTRRFEGSDFSNLVIVFGDKNKFTNAQTDNILFFKRTPNNIRKIIKICSEANLVVLHDLDAIKQKIAISLPSEVTIAWRFYGYELYSINANLYYTDLTKKAEKELFIEAFYHLINKKIQKIKSFFKWRHFLKVDNKKVIKRINYFLGYSLEEYNYLKLNYPELPSFIRISIEIIGKFNYNKSPSEKSNIIVGNNRSAYNNHFDIIKLIKLNNNPEKYDFIFPFNYGNISNYAKQVVKITSKLENLFLIEKMMTFNEYNLLFNQSQAIIINGFKQMALGNIFIAIHNGLKIYLNKNNEILYWLTNNGLHIYNIEDFSKDLLTGNTKLSYSFALENYEKFVYMSTSYNNEDFRIAIKNGIMDCNSKKI